jgi:hypothetical protein
MAELRYPLQRYKTTECYDDGRTGGKDYSCQPVGAAAWSAASSNTAQPFSGCPLGRRCGKWHFSWDARTGRSANGTDPPPPPPVRPLLGPPRRRTLGTVFTVAARHRLSFCLRSLAAARVDVKLNETIKASISLPDSKNYEPSLSFIVALVAFNASQTPSRISPWTALFR